MWANVSGLGSCGSHTKFEKGYAPFFCHVGFSRNKGSIKSGELVPGGFGQSKGRKTKSFSVVSPLDQNPDQKYKPHLNLKKHHILMSVINLEAAHNSLDIHQAANGSGSCYDAVPAEFLTIIINN